MAKKKAYMFYNCDLEKTTASMNPLYNTEVFSSTKAGRKALVKKLQSEIKKGSVKLIDGISMDTVERIILEDNPKEVTASLVFGAVLEVSLY